MAGHVLGMAMRNRSHGIGAALALTLSCLLCTTVLAEEIRIGGGGAAITGMILPYVDTFGEETGIKLTVTASSGVDGLIELEKGTIDVVAAADPLAEMVSDASSRGVTIDSSRLHQRELGTSYTRVFLHKGVKIEKLTQKQLKGIFTGKITNWKALGGSNQKIVVVWGHATPGQNAIFTRRILDGEPVTKKHLQATDYGDIKNKITETPGAIGINPEDFMNSQVRFPEAPVLARPIIVVTKGDPSPKLKKLLDFLVEIAASLASYNQKGYF